MQKRILLMLFVLYSHTTCAMENEASKALVAVRSLLPKLLKKSSNPLSPMQKMQADKNKFEDWLWRSSGWLSRYSMDTYNELPVCSYDIYCKPVRFLKYCSMQYLHNAETNMLSWVGWNCFVSLADRCRQARKKGYSALGAAILAKGMSDKYKRNFIYRLLQYGFTATEKDKTLARLVIYEAISAKLLFLLHASPDGDFLVLPQDVRRYIAYYSIRLLEGKELYSLLLQQ